MRVFVTGGTGYIGSHAVVALLRAGHYVSIFDDLSNSRSDVVDRIDRISGVRPEFRQGDIRDSREVRAALSEWEPHALMHFAGLKSVAESVSHPLRYYETNVGGTVTLLTQAADLGIRTVVFSSSCTVYEESASARREDSPIAPSNPYGRSKAMAEQVMRDLHSADRAWSFALLRYFNPVGADESGLIGEDPKSPPTNLMPVICRVASETEAELRVFGDDYDTPDGTALRDYLHVSDLAEAHVAALEAIHGRAGIKTWNLGTGRPVSVRQLVETFEATTRTKVPTRVGPRRPGDVAAAWANADRVRVELGWQATRSLAQMCADAWNFERATRLQPRIGD